MKGLKATSVAKKKLDIEYIVSLLIQFLFAECVYSLFAISFVFLLSSTKKRKADVDATKKGRAKKKDSGAPKRPLTAFLLFMYIFIILCYFKLSIVLQYFHSIFLIFSYVYLVFFYLFDFVSAIAMILWYTGVISARITRRIFLITNLWPL